MRLPAFALAAAMVLAAVSADAAPEPSEYSSSWHLDIDFQNVRPILVQIPGQGAPQLFWYMIYTVTNNTGEDQIFVPDFVLYTGTGQIVRAGKSVPATVYDTIKRLHNDPLLKDMTGMTGKILQGRDNAKTGVAIWSDFDPQAGGFDIFVGGLSGETAVVELPKPITVDIIDAITGDKTSVTKERIVLTRTLDLSYSVPGEAAARHRAAVRLLERKWVMR